MWGPRHRRRASFRIRDTGFAVNRPSLRPAGSARGRLPAVRVPDLTSRGAMLTVCKLPCEARGPIFVDCPVGSMSTAQAIEETP